LIKAEAGWSIEDRRPLTSDEALAAALAVTPWRCRRIIVSNQIEFATVASQHKNLFQLPCTLPIIIQVTNRILLNASYQ
jgi:hypothetical protein